MHSNKYALKETGVTNTLYFDSPDEQEEHKNTVTVLNDSLQRNYPSTGGHKFSWLNFTYTPLAGNIFIKHRL